MPDMPESVSKGPILTKIDKLTTAEMTNILAELEVHGKSSDVVAIMDSHGLLSPQEKRHLEDDWFNLQGTGWWQARQPIQPIIAVGFINALKTALENKGPSGQLAPLPLDCYWVCSTGHHDADHEAHHAQHPHGMDGAIEVAIMKNERQVTVLIHTPGGGVNSVTVQHPVYIPEPIWVVAMDASGMVGVYQADAHGTFSCVPG